MTTLCGSISRERQGNQRRAKAFTVRHGGPPLVI